MGRKSLEKLMEEVRKRNDIPAEEKGSLMEKIRILKEKRDELRAQIGPNKMGRKRLMELKEEVRKRNDISEEEKESLMEKIRKLDKEKDDLLTQIDLKKWKSDPVKEVEKTSEIIDNELQKKVDELQIEVEWRRTRTYADNITLDAGTAHPNLSIAGDHKSLKHEAQPQKVPPNPERFDSTVCVLASEGFSSGKHYWEVDVVSSSDWDLGVARKSIERKGKLSLSPKDGFWALGFSGRDYWAKTDPWTRVMVQKKPKKIGIYLSYQDKQVTFFNVTDMSVLFTFNNCSFSEEVYPFFKNSHKETSMKICSIREDE
ncbi:butyrophilin subfamily 1 member A1-like isoform X2 [Chrysemys picta bellii]|uniref:butyrophilin subfamily 1 member A1-like isoform X2 n=1 Tax=Chrysemys picta bellii TaxID=8478 RepID=UPI0032B16FC7